MEFKVYAHITTFNDPDFDCPDIGKGWHLDAEPTSGEAAAEAVILQFSGWDEWGEISNPVYRVRIHSPDKFAGHYVVGCQRTTTATAERYSPC
jgi:hypothetical protein